MTYVDVTLTPAATYSYVHNGQIYDQIAGTLAAHGAWQYVEYVDATNSGNTFRRHIWRCKSAQSGLPADFYVMFQTQFVTATGVYSQTIPVYPFLAEVYATGVLSKFASNETSITPAADLTNPATWTLSTYAPPPSAFFWQNSDIVSIGPAVTSTSIRLLYIVAKDGIMTNWGNLVNSGSANASYPSYVGAYDSILGAVADPMPLVIFSSSAGASTRSAGACTRAPLQTPGVAITEVFGASHNWQPGQGTNHVGTATPYSNIPGILGSPANTGWVKTFGGVQVTRCWLSGYTTNTNTNSAKGVVRGWSKYVRAVNSVAVHSIGDTFLVDGKVYVGLNSYNFGVWDTTAA